MKKTILFFISFLFTYSVNAQDKDAYQIFNAKGKKANYKNVLKSSINNDIIFFGELHNNPISHWLQYELSFDMLKNSQLVFGAEMFETDNQDELNLYLMDSIDTKGLDTLARLWKNYKTDYAPLVDLAKENNALFIATNIPRKYANLVYMEGFEALDTLPENEKEWIAPLPIDYDPDLPGYKDISTMSSHGGEKLPKAQAIKDATMAYFISENFDPSKKFIHFNGTYHSNNYEGILWYMKKLHPELNYLTIATVTQSQVRYLDEENKGIADFIICVDENMTTTY